MAETHIRTLHAEARPPRHRIRFKARGASLGLDAASSAELIRKLERGFAFDALQSLASQSGIAVSRLAAILAIPERTLARRKTSGRLTLDESERLLRIANVFEKAVELYEGDVAAAVNWLAMPKKALDNHIPLDYSRTELGAREVENLIGRLEHGVFS
jgi:putative toxin-antitoxin system antitoxin component (TIGR02293 family)